MSLEKDLFELGICKSMSMAKRIAKTKDAQRKVEEKKMSRGNFRGEDGTLYVVYCPRCNRENWAMAVATGKCAWCGWSE